nr:5'/3'-nucleotidase SurE [Lutispora thermophila]
MNILVSNDDGISSLGIYELARALKKIGNVIVVSPESERSASGHSITMHKPLRSNKVNFNDADIEAWSINGTPSDCVKFALEVLVKSKIDLVVSGINRGPNMGTDVLYSGTVSAAIEGAIYGKPSVAISLSCNEECDFKASAKISAYLCQKLYEFGIEKDTVMNVNIPNVPYEDIKGIKITRLGVRKYKNCFEERKDPRGKSYYWLAGELDETGDDEGTDIKAIKENYISITPIKIDLTSYECLNKMKRIHWSSAKIHD